MAEAQLRLLPIAKCQLPICSLAKESAIGSSQLQLRKLSGQRCINRTSKYSNSDQARTVLAHNGYRAQRFS
jgi:hypothetical protein